MTADSSEQSREAQAIQSLQEKRASSIIVKIIDSFIHKGPNGNHQCLVLELLGPTIDAVVADYGTLEDRLEPETILKITKQLLQAVAFLHKALFAHGGGFIILLYLRMRGLTLNSVDVSGANIAFTSRNLTQLSKKKIFRVIGSPEWENLIRLDGKAIEPGMPTQLVKTAVWDNWVEEDEEDVRLIDFGEAFAHGNEPSTLAQPKGLEAPETIFIDSFDYRVDLWRVGCTVQQANANFRQTLTFK
jgi:serine/threonine-protein kinase SRPK3